MARKDESDAMEFSAVDLREGDEDEAGIPAWQCSVCGTVQPMQNNPCQCGHPRNDEPESDDWKILNWHPNEGEQEVFGENEMIDGEGEEIDDEPGAPEFSAHLDVVRPEGEAAATEDTDDWDSDDGNESEQSWGMELVDVTQEPIIVKQEVFEPEGVEPSHPDKGWVCGACNGENSIMDLQCNSCQKYRNMREDGFDDVILLRAEVTAGQRPNKEPEEKDREVFHEVWPCPECSSVNDFNPAHLVCYRCNHAPDSTKGELMSFLMGDAEYQTLVGGRRQQRANGGGGGGGIGGGGVGGGGGSAFNFGFPSSSSAARDGGGGGGGSFGSKKKNPKPQIRNLRAHNDNFANTPAVVRRNARPSAYPVRSDLGFKEPNRLGQQLGAPQALACFAGQKHFWRNGVLVYPCLGIPEMKEEGGLSDRGFDTNEEGYLAVLSERKLRVFRPSGSSFELRCEAALENPAKSGHRLRVRYRGDIVYVFRSYRIERYMVDPEHSGEITVLGEFSDEYMSDQKFSDVDVRDGFVTSVWRKWAGLYKSKDFSWFHAVSTSTVVINPKSMTFRNAYLHVTMGSSLLAFHVSSRDPTVLWINGNLPIDEDIPFCVSDTYGVFVRCFGDIVQSYYDAATAQSLFADSCGPASGSPAVTPAPTARGRSKHMVHRLLTGPAGNPFSEVTHIEYDERYGAHGRLLCWNKEGATMFMVLNREEFDDLEALFRDVFLDEMKVPDLDEDGGEDIPAFGLLDLATIQSLSLNDRVDFRCEDTRFRLAIVRATGGGNVVLGFDDPAVPVERVEDAENCLDRFALPGAITTREATRLKEIDVGFEVEVNVLNTGWTPATVQGFDDIRGQVEVRLGNGEARWTHLDFENEVRLRQVDVAVATEYVEEQDGVSHVQATEGAVNMMEDLTREQKENIETTYVDFANRFSEAVVQWFLSNSLRLSVRSSPTGLTVTRPSY